MIFKRILSKKEDSILMVSQKVEILVVCHSEKSEKSHQINTL